ncbi:MAG: nuclear transport factor 2 family protein, partial [Endozoicomonas sp.]
MLNLEAIELIKQLKSRYFRYLDTCNMDGMKTVFSEDGEVHYTSPSYSIHHKGWNELEKFFSSTFTETKFGIHIGTNPEITVAEDGENATGIWYLRDIFVSLDDNVQVEGSA